MLRTLFSSATALIAMLGKALAEGRLEERLKAAKLPTRKTLEEFDFSFQPSVSERLLWELAELSFLKTHTNLVFLGPPGVGKTHLSLGLSVKALEAGYSVLFTTFADLTEDLAAVPHPSLLRKRLRRYLAPRLLIIDEIGYLPIAARAPTCSSNRSSAAMNAVRYHHQQSESRRLGEDRESSGNRFAT